MKKCYLFLLAVFLHETAFSQIVASFDVMVDYQRRDISPYIYGINNGVYKKATWRRWGGNRTSAYNWENNFSNAGHDWFHNNDDYIPWVSNLPLSQYLVPASPLVAFHGKMLCRQLHSLWWAT